MSKNYVFLIISVLALISLLAFDYMSYDIEDHEVVDEIIVVLEDLGIDDYSRLNIVKLYNRFGAAFWYGTFSESKSDGVFIFGYERHWLVDKYKSPNFRLSRFNDDIREPGVIIDNGLISYRGYTTSGASKFVVDEGINVTNLVQLVLVIGAYFLGMRIAKRKRYSDRLA